MIEFKDVTGAVLGRPGESFFKMDSISDEAIQGYLDRGAKLVRMDEESHAHALKLKTAREKFKADEALGRVPVEQDLEDLSIARLRQTRQASADLAREADKIAEEAVARAKINKAAKKRVGRPPKGKNHD